MRNCFLLNWIRDDDWRLISFTFLTSRRNTECSPGSWNLLPVWLIATAGNFQSMTCCFMLWTVGMVVCDRITDGRSLVSVNPSDSDRMLLLMLSSCSCDLCFVLLLQTGICSPQCSLSAWLFLIYIDCIFCMNPLCSAHAFHQSSLVWQHTAHTPSVSTLLTYCIFILYESNPSHVPKHCYPNWLIPATSHLKHSWRF